VRLMGERFVEDEVYETYVLLGVRLILMDRRAKSIMMEIKEDDLAAYRLVMADAWRRYASLPDELKADKGKGIASLMEEGEKLQLRMIEKAREAGVFDLPG